jgi:hypothetical protein
LYGDIYYDLAKLYSGIEIPYDKVKKKDFSVNVRPGLNKWSDADYNIDISSNLSSFRTIYEDWLKRSDFSIDRVRLLSALVFLNMSPLHPYPIGDLFFLHANLRLAILFNSKNTGFVKVG